ncbi:MAG: hypothetical protein AABZ74_04380, partial [Cyanobacteriota bacterium]
MRKITTAFLFLLLLFHNSNSYAKNYSESKIVSETGDCNKNEPCLSIVIKSLKLDKTIKNNSKINEYIKNEALSMF